ncbi:hypothetical protein J6590_064425 [Homalodisca vitripennis]|nr:hypothetical protein J6590_064425 [Homalodisca vitripennis]
MKAEISKSRAEERKSQRARPARGENCRPALLESPYHRCLMVITPPSLLRVACTDPSLASEC